jgi:hypothetical protein
MGERYVEAIRPALFYLFAIHTGAWVFKGAKQRASVEPT